MNLHHGSVVDVDLARGVLIVRPETPIACARCAAGRGCGAGVMRNTVDDLTMPIEPGSSSPAIGDRVALTMPAGSLLRAAAIVYGWPLVGAVGASVAGSMWTASDSILALLAVAGLLAGFLLARWHAGRRCRMPGIAVS